MFILVASAKLSCFFYTQFDYYLERTYQVHQSTDDSPQETYPRPPTITLLSGPRVYPRRRYKIRHLQVLSQPANAISSSNSRLDMR